MCGIAGAEDPETVRSLIDNMDHRGVCPNVEGNDDFCIGHRLHSVVGKLEQPIRDEGLLSANCEIYNWKELNKKNNWQTENDAGTLLKILDSKDTGLEGIDGIYAFAYMKDQELMIGRDKLGVNPIWYTEPDDFAFASEKQALEKAGYTDIKRLHPRKILYFNIEEQSIRFEDRDFFEIDVNKDRSLEEAAQKIKENILKAVKKRLPKEKPALLFSGGLDSTLIAGALQELDKEFTAYTAGIEHGNVSAPRDYQMAQEVADEMGFTLERYKASLEEVKKAIPRLVEQISTTNVVKIGVGLPIHFSLNQGGNEKVVFSGFGSEQLYAGYTRQQGYLNKECLSDLRSIYHEDLYRDSVIAFRNGRELRTPFLDQDLVEQALTIPGDMKRTEKYKKYILRKAAEKLGIPEKVIWREKVAAQYGSNFDKALDTLTGKSEYQHKQKYLNQYREEPNKKLVALTSGGKDSNAALFRMSRRNNEISCLLTLRSENKDSYMFDSDKSQKDIDWQSQKLDIPMIKQDTKGKKEEELDDLISGLQKAKEQYKIEGIVAGAIESTYQRDRIDMVAETVGLEVFTPLWQFDQRQYMNWLVREGFEFKITDVATRGMDNSWVGKKSDEKMIHELLGLSEEYSFHPAGEGGEYETKITSFPEELLN